MCQNNETQNKSPLHHDDPVGLYKRAKSLFDDCKFQLSFPSLDSAIHVLQTLTEQCGDLPLSGYSFNKEVFRYLCTAFWTRYIHTANLADFGNALRAHTYYSKFCGISQTMESTLHNEDDDNQHQNTLSIGRSLIADFHKPMNLKNLDTVILLYRQVLDASGIAEEDFLSSLNDLAAALIVRFQCTHRLDDIHEGISFYYILESRLTPGFHNTFPLLCLAGALFIRSLHTDSALEASEVKRILSSAMPKLPFEVESATNAFLKFKQNGMLSSLEEAIALFRHVVQFMPLFSHQRFVPVNNLGLALFNRYEATKRDPDLDEATVILEHAIRLQDSTHPNYILALENLLDCLQARYNQTDKLTDLDAALDRCQKAITLRSPSHPKYVVISGGLMQLLKDRYDRTHDTFDRDQCIQFGRDLLRTTSSALELEVSNTSHASLLARQAETIIITQYGCTESVADLEEAIDLCRRSLELRDWADSEAWNPRRTLAYALLQRFQHATQESDLTESIQLYQIAIDCARPRQSSFTNLAQALLFRFDLHDVDRDLADLEQAITYLQQALRLAPANPVPLSAMAGALIRRFKYRGSLTDLDESISLCYQALTSLPGSDPRRDSSLQNLSAALSNRYDATGELSDVDSAIHLLREILVLSRHRTPAVLTNLAMSLHDRYQKTENFNDLEESIALCREAVGSDTHSTRTRPFYALVKVLRSKFKRTKKLFYLEEAIQAQEKELEFDSSIRSLFNAANLIMTRYEETKDPADACKAKEIYQRIKSSPNQYRDPDLSYLLGNLAGRLFSMNSDNPQPEYLDDVITAFRAAVHNESASPLNRFYYAKQWAKAADLYKLDSALDAYLSAISFLPRIATLDLDLEARQRALLSKVGSLASDAARCAIDAGDPQKAIEILEEGRAVFWSQALRLRTPLDKLTDAAPLLAERLKTISMALESSSWRSSVRDENPLLNVSWEQTSTRLRQLNNDYAQVVNEIRQMDGFQDFHLPRSINSLKLAASEGFIVVLNAAESRCDALIISPEKVSCLHLPDVDYGHVKACHTMIQEALSPCGRNIGDGGLQILDDYMQSTRKAKLVSDKSNLPPNELLKGVLWILWKDIVKPILQFLRLSKSSSPPRLWWCPTGPLTFLPLHATGVDNDWVFEYVISSYIPSVSTLLNATSAHAPAHLQDDAFKMAVLIESSTLPATKKELEKIQERVPAKHLEVLAPQMRIDDALETISTSSIVHFACHGRQDPREPLQSYLLLASGRLEMIKIMQKQMPNAVLAFLSACETAMGDEDMEDEVIHMSATMLFSGFRSVVGTMWSIADKDGPKLAEAFYRHLFPSKPELIDVTKSAEALHHALNELRPATDGDFKRWVPFVHYGL